MSRSSSPSSAISYSRFNSHNSSVISSNRNVDDEPERTGAAFSVSAPSYQLDTDTIKEDFRKFGFTDHLVDQMIQYVQSTAMFVLLIDDSESMTTLGGRVCSRHDGKICKFNIGSRSEEAEEVKEFHDWLKVHFMSKYKTIKFSEIEGLQMNPWNSAVNSSAIQTILEECQIGQQVVIVVTDGESNIETVFGKAVQEMRMNDGVELRLVFRLCTDNRNTLARWQLAKDIGCRGKIVVDVISNQYTEAQAIFRKNPWLVYGEPLHRMRELGMRDWAWAPEASMEKWSRISLNTAAMQNILYIINGEKLSLSMWPAWFWAQTVESFKNALKQDLKIYCPVRRCELSWFDTDLMSVGYKKEYQF